MSNDAKFWMVRILFWLGLSIDSWIMTKMAMRALITPTAGQHPHTGLWFILFILATCALVPLALWYRRAKAERYSEVRRKTQTQIEVEALAAYAAEEHKARKPPTAPPA